VRLALGTKLDMTLAILNGLVGDHLVRTQNALATELSFIHDGKPLAMDPASVAKSLPHATPKVAILVHGLMCTETVFQLPDGGDYGTRLERDLGYTPVRVRYNSGRAIVDNGSALAHLIASLASVYPVPLEEILLVAFSMGGLVVRSACHVAKLENMSWLGRVARAMYLGTPHRGAPLERAGRVLTRVLRAVPDPYTRLIADVADVRSDGLRDLGEADLRHEDRELTRLSSRFSLRDPRHPVPLLDGIRHYLVAGNVGIDPRIALYFGDTIVPLHSATGQGCVAVESLAIPPDRVKILDGYSHLRLAHDDAVYAQISAWCSEP
jgi:triacylglycerol lipase